MGIVVKDRGLVVTVRVFCWKRETGELTVKTVQNSVVWDARGRGLGLSGLSFKGLGEVRARSKYW